MNATRLYIFIICAFFILVMNDVSFAGFDADTNGDGKVRVGMVSDIEGAIDNSEIAANKLSRSNIDLIVIAGDTYENEQKRRKPKYPNSTDNLAELVEGIEPIAKLGVPVYVIPGNHENITIYNQGIFRLQKRYPNVINADGKSFDLDGLNIVGMGGYYNSNSVAQGGKVLEKSDYQKARGQLMSFHDSDMTVLITHSPPKTDRKIDYVYGVGNVGDANITALMTAKSIFVVCGHIHERGGNWTEIGDSSAWNAASVTNYSNPNAPAASVFEINNGKLRLEK